MRIQALLLFVPMWVACGRSSEPIPTFGGFEQFEGTWKGNTGEVKYSESWRIEGQRMYGLGYIIKGKDSVLFEKLVVEWVNDKLVYIADIRGQDPVIFTAKEQGKMFRFENREHDFPKEIVYLPENKNELKIKVEGIEDGVPLKEEISFKKQP